MTNQKQNLRPWVSALHRCLIGLGLMLAAWQFFTFVSLVQVHTAQAEKRSRMASWSGRPVGAVAMPVDGASQRLLLEHAEEWMANRGAGWVQVNLP